jgi:hypothetical protein
VANTPRPQPLRLPASTTYCTDPRSPRYAQFPSSFIMKSQEIVESWLVLSAANKLQPELNRLLWIGSRQLDVARNLVVHFLEK